MGKLDGRVVLITGAARGMGAEHARFLANEGAHVAVCDILDDDARDVAQEIGGSSHHLDVTSEEQWQRVVDDVTAQAGPVSDLVNNAGIPSLNPVQDISSEEWHRVMAVNLTGVFFGIRAVVPGMRQLGSGAIVNVSSAAGMTGMPGITAYLTSKWGVRGLTRAAALDLAPDGIRVLSVHPGMVSTPMAEGVAMEKIAQRRPIPRPGRTDELSKLVLFLLADATFSTGTEFVADGGHTAGIYLPTEAAEDSG